MRRRPRLVAALGLLVAAGTGIYLSNASWLAPAPTGTPKLLAYLPAHFGGWPNGRDK